MQTTHKYLQMLILCSIAFGVGTTTFAQEDAATKPRFSETTFAAWRAEQTEHFSEAGALYEQLAAQKPITIQDEVMPLLQAAQNYLRAKDFDRAEKIYQRVLTIPAAPNAHPPAMSPGPVDLRGEAGWGLAETARARGQWQKALDLYRLNRQQYPRDDGCVRSGAAYQQMVLVEGVCLEHLGRTDEAIALYWPVAVHLSAEVPPHALRRLVDLYKATGQSEVLQRAVAREREEWLKNWRDVQTGQPRNPNDAEQNERFAREWVRAPWPNFERVWHFRTAAQQKYWNLLVDALRAPQPPYAPDFDEEVAQWNRREALAALEGQTQAAPTINEALGKYADNGYLLTAAVLCGARDGKSLEKDKAMWVQQISEEMNGYGATINFPAPTAKPLPSLPSSSIPLL